VFTSNGPMASTAGLAPLAGRRDPAAVKAALRAAGYQGEKVVLLQATDVDNLNGLGSVAADELARAGLNLDVQTGDWGSISQRRANRGPLDKGGWSIFMTSLSNTIDPGGHLALRTNGAKAWFGWPDIPRIEELREAWFDAPDLASQQKICADIQLQVMTEAPYIPVGENRSICAARRDITHIFSGAPYFYDVRRES
jgi:peptide/nickel transport system substrate-binding protein